MRLLASCLISAFLISPGLLLLAFPTGPGPGRTGGPGDGGTCNGGSCHFGATVRGEGIALYLRNGPFYRPGQTQRIEVQVVGTPLEPETARYGFQVSARMASNPSGAPGGRFRIVDPATWVQCFDAALPGPEGCRTGQEIEYVQHSSPARIPVWEIDWTPPLDAEGPIQIYVAANAANGRGDQAGDRIYQKSFTINPAGPLTVSNFLGVGILSPLSWMRIQGPFPEAGEISLGGTVMGSGLQPLPGQLLVQVPADLSEGLQPLVVRGLESPVAIARSSPVIADTHLPRFVVGETASVLVFGCGVEPARTEVWLANRIVHATSEIDATWYGVCRLNFTVPSVVPSEYLLRACVDGSCSPAKTLVEVVN